MTDKSAEVYELGPVPPAGQPVGNYSKNIVATSQSRGLKVGRGLTTFLSVNLDTDIRLQQDLKTSPIFFFGLVVVGTWEAYSNTAVISLSNGGPRSSIIGVFVAGAGAWCIVRSLANMAKQEPYIGAQYRWTKMYCPPGLQPLFWSHIQGWLVSWAWIVSAAVLPYYTASQILGIVTLYHPDYISEGWHVYLVAVAFMIIPILANVYARGALKWIELVGGACHMIAYIVITAVLWAAAPTNTVDFVFSQPSEVPTGWTNPAIRMILGMQATLLPLSGTLSPASLGFAF
jgi:choline transport protein